MNPSRFQNQIRALNFNEKIKKQFETCHNIISIPHIKMINKSKSELGNKNNSGSTFDTYNHFQKKLLHSNTKTDNIEHPNIVIEPDNKFIFNKKINTDIKKHNNPKLINTLFKEKLEEFYKDKLKISLLSKTNLEEINDSISITKKIEEQINNIQNLEKDHEKEEMKMLYRTNCKNDVLIYNKFFGCFYGFLATTFKNRKKENNDKLQIKLNLIDEKTDKKIFYFGLFSGHKGTNVSKYLKDNLGELILKDKNKFLLNPIKIIKNSFEEIEKNISLENQKKLNIYEKGGSCVLVFFHFDKKIYIGNCGNLRSVISSKLGNEINQLSIDHIPNEENEKKRIELHGGKIIKKNNIYYINPSNFLFTRSIGNFDIKNKNKEMIISEPDVIEIDVSSNMDFIIIGGYELFQYTTNDKICKSVFNSFYKGIKENLDYQDILSKVSDNIIENAIDNGAKDNLSIIVLIMENLYNLYNNNDIKSLENIMKNICLNIDDCNKLYTPNKFYGYNIIELNRINSNVYEESKESISEDAELMQKQKIKKKRKRFLSCLCFK
jgi:serine/threonine protein phosphatase PrpC